MNALIYMPDLMKYDMPAETALLRVLQRVGFDMERPYHERLRQDLGSGVIEFTQDD